jgi:hypothetical protein
MTNSLPNTARAFANCDDHDVETEKGLSSRARYFRDRAVPYRKGQAMPVAGRCQVSTAAADRSDTLMQRAR